LRLTLCVSYLKPLKRNGTNDLFINVRKNIMKELTPLEQMILAAIIALEENAYGVSIRKRVAKMTGKRLMYGTLYNALDQLLRKGYVSKTKGTTLSEKGGRPRIYYALTSEGGRALKDSFELHRAIFQSIPEFLEN